MLPLKLEHSLADLRTLSEPNRLSITLLLSAGPMLVGDLAKSTQLPLPLVSQHLRVLRSLGLVEKSRDHHDGRAIWYSLNRDKIREIQVALGMFFDLTKVLDRRMDSSSLDTIGISNHNFRVLFLCSHNSARSQMAEALLRQLGDGLFEAESAGIHPTEVHPCALRVLRENGVGIHNLRSKPLDELIGKEFNYLITVCDQANEECPGLPGNYQRLHWSIADPVGEGPEDTVYQDFVRVRDELRQRVEFFIAAHHLEAERLKIK